MSKESFISKWGYRLRKLLIILIGLNLSFKIGNILLPEVIDIAYDDILRLIFVALVIFLITVIMSPILLVPIMLAAVCIILYKVMKNSKKEQQNIDQVQPDKQNPKQGDDATHTEAPQQIKDLKD